MRDYKAEYLKWQDSSLFDQKTVEEIKNITDEREIEDRFYKDLSFGTGGLRGIIGAGTNRMNLYTVGKATQGFANFINENASCPSVVIGYDSRNMSYEFAVDTALIFVANGIKAYLFDALRPTPELSFAIRTLKATAGVMITASHNPPEYNGYKAFWSDGAQLTAPLDRMVIDKVNEVSDYSMIKRVEYDCALKSGELQIIGESIDNLYVETIKSAIINVESIKKQAKNVKIVYTPLNGTGRIPILRTLGELGFDKVWCVKEQELPDGNFPTLKYPNPEDKNAFNLALELAKKVNADIVMATDPDADRLGIYVKTENGYAPFTGNMSGLLLAEYELSQLKERGILGENSSDFALVTTIVSSDMAKSIAKEYGVTLFEVLTGFKYIGEKIRLFEQAIKDNDGKIDGKKGAYRFLFGYEESYGCLLGTHARDKDAVMAVTILAEAACYYKDKGVSLYEQMENIYKKYGYFKESLTSKILSGIDGVEKMKSIMQNLRENPPTEIGGRTVVRVFDYSLGNVNNLPKSDVLYFELENGWCAVRPSGTEPKIKFYYGVKGVSNAEAESGLEQLSKALLRL